VRRNFGAASVTAIRAPLCQPPRYSRPAAGFARRDIGLRS